MKGVDGQHEFEGSLEATTQKAILFLGDYWEDSKPRWFGRRSIEITIDPTDEDRATILVPDWMAKREGIADYE